MHHKATHRTDVADAHSFAQHIFVVKAQARSTSLCHILQDSGFGKHALFDHEMIGWEGELTNRGLLIVVDQTIDQHKGRLLGQEGENVDGI